MISSAQIKAKLAECAALAFVGGAGDFASAAEQLNRSKSAFVMPPTETAAPSTTGTQVTRQRCDVRFRIVLGFLVRSATREDQTGDVDSVREALKETLIGWTPDPETYAPVNLVGTAALAAGKDGVTVFYACDFRTFYFLRAIP